LANIYTIYADHNDNISAHDFVAKMKLFLDKLVKHRKMDTYRITRMKLGFRSMDMPEFRIDMEFDNMQALDDAMTVTIHDKDVDRVHVGFNQFVNVDTIQHFLYRDFPDVPPADLNTSTLTEQQKSYTIEEIVQATKDIEPDTWKK
jgi:F0F1-type ATP synthase gamma subunit